MQAVKVAHALLGLLLLALPVQAIALSVQVQAILGETVIVVIDGQQQTLNVGESVSGVTLVAAQPTAATLEIMGETRTVPPSQTISTQFEAPREQVVTIVRDARLQYQTGAVINGRRAQVMVDTGANLVALSSAQARQMNIDYSGGKPSRVQTASGMGDAYAITLDTVSIGGIEVRNVPAMVVKGDYPAMILLGMSYLRHVSMQEKNGVLSLFRSQ
ncbi:retropepsin-like aspartic protease family protein [Candidatus Marimicrobium litorale]|uniref:TIGR02281 family clan AA aspartic protease n=1 Tax=Candidatus Marimicrobium litorale TaxID=2518991 RepID=A0ABT3TA05_9GAMM|nr:TIGR02281 family clan AA aspartic protease [Candidatus Marimicrobium litorale]MCX2979020.1 TIGR02281 family clan AA aspartic protease [Candidatus Marimicrobium litorale]